MFDLGELKSKTNNSLVQSLHRDSVGSKSTQQGQKDFNSMETTANYKEYFMQVRDLGTANASKLSHMATNSSAVKSQQAPSANTTKVPKTTDSEQLTKMFDLTSTVPNKNLKNLAQLRKTAVQWKRTKKSHEMTFQQLMCEKDHNAKPMNYQCDIRRLTQLFNRPLQMKYFAKIQPDEKPKV